MYKAQIKLLFHVILANIKFFSEINCIFLTYTVSLFYTNIKYIKTKEKKYYFFFLISGTCTTSNLFGINSYTACCSEMSNEQRGMGEGIPKEKMFRNTEV